jgi:hypothetical protein
MEPTTAPTKHSTTLSPRERSIRWIGGVIRPRGLLHRGKPMRVAAWIDQSGSLVGAAIVEGHGPTVLRELLDEQLLQTEPDQRPNELVVWPSVRAAFHGLEYPTVSFERDRFLTVVVEDLADFGQIPAGLRVRVGCSG